MPAFLLSLREGLEAALVIGIVLGALHKLKQTHSMRYVWFGVGAAVVASLGMALGLNALGAKFEGRSEQIFEGTLMLFAAVVLTAMIFWMQHTGAHLKERLTADVKTATHSARQGASLFLLAFLAVFREGVELALFLIAAAFASSPKQTLVGAVLGLAAAAGLGLLLFATTIRLNLKLFFQVTSLLLIVFAAGMVAYGCHELIEAGLLPGLVDPLYNVNALLDDKAGAGLLLKTLFGYNGNPALFETIAYLAYYAVIWLALRGQRQRMPVRANV